MQDARIARAALLAVWIASASACTKASESQEAKRTPKPPPPPIPSAEVLPVSIAVEIDGAPAPPIDGARLAATHPDYEEEDRRAWRVGTLLGRAADRPGATISVTGDRGVALVAHPPRTLADPIPVVFVSRRGEANFALVTPGEPFPGYHGQGGRLARPGDPLPRIHGVTRIRVSLDMDAAAAR